MATGEMRVVSSVPASATSPVDHRATRHASMHVLAFVIALSLAAVGAELFGAWGCR